MKKIVESQRLSTISLIQIRRQAIGTREPGRYPDSWPGLLCSALEGFASLVGNGAARLAGGLARCLAFTAGTLASRDMDASFTDGLDVFHTLISPSFMIKRYQMF